MENFELPQRTPPPPYCEIEQEGGPTFVFPATTITTTEFDYSRPPPFSTSSWSCVMPVLHELDSVAYILGQNEKFFLQQIQTIGRRSLSVTVVGGFRLLDREGSQILTMCHVPGERMRRVGGSGRNTVDFIKLGDEIRCHEFPPGHSNNVLLVGKESRETLAVSSVDLVLGTVEGFSPSLNLFKTLTGKNMSDAQIFQILPENNCDHADGAGTYEDANDSFGDYKILGETGLLIGRAKKEGRGMKICFLSDIGGSHLDVRTKALILVSIAFMFIKYHADTIYQPGGGTSQIESARQRRLNAIFITIFCGFVVAIVIFVVQIWS